MGRNLQTLRWAMNGAPMVKYRWNKVIFLSRMTGYVFGTKSLVSVHGFPYLCYCGGEYLVVVGPPLLTEVLFSCSMVYFIIAFSYQIFTFPSRPSSLSRPLGAHAALWRFTCCGSLVRRGIFIFAVIASAARGLSDTKLGMILATTLIVTR
jgi:hypothetical protein